MTAEASYYAEAPQSDDYDWPLPYGYVLGRMGEDMKSFATRCRARWPGVRVELADDWEDEDEV